MIAHLILKPDRTKYVFQSAIFLQIYRRLHFSSKNSNHLSIEIEILYIYLHRLATKITLNKAFCTIISLFKVFRRLHGSDSDNNRVFAAAFVSFELP